MKLPDFSYEKSFWDKGIKFVAGCDEVGRGSLAGPVVTGVVIFPGSSVKRLVGSAVIINDSKKLTQKQREKADSWIKSNALAYGIGCASAQEIDKFSIVKATNIAYHHAIKAVNQLNGLPVQQLLIDAFYIPYTRGIKKKNQLPIIKGDSLSVSIAAASIIAKVYRDNLMLNLSKYKKYENYLWEKNKGYGTKKHLIAIKKYGKSALHRASFLLNLS